MHSNLREIDISIVTATYNEANRIGPFLDELYTVMKTLPHSFEIIVCEDGSTDATDLVVQKYSEKYPEVRLIHHDVRLGKGKALIHGFKACKGNILVMIDSDGAYFPSDIPRLIEKINEDVDCAIGSRALEDSTLITRPSTIFTLLKRHIAGVLFNYLVRVLFSINIRDTQAGLKVFKREVIDAIIEKLSTTGFEIDVEILMRAKQAGFKIIEVPITFRYLKNSKINILTDGLKMGIGILRVRFLDSYRGRTPPKAYVDAVKHFLIQKKVAEKSHRNLYCSKNPFKRFLHNIRRKTVSTSVNTNAFTLEVGCGDGYILSKLKNAIGVDLVPLRAKRAKSLTRKEVIVADAENLPFKQDAFQCIVATEVLEHLRDPVKAIFEIKRVAENNSDLIMTIPNERNFRIAGFFMMQKPIPAHLHSLNEEFLQSLFPLKFKHNLPIKLPFHLSLHHCGVYINRKYALKNSNNWCLDRSIDRYLKNSKINILVDGLKMGLGILRIRFSAERRKSVYHSKNPLNRFLHNKRLKIVKDLVLAKMSSMISWVKICLFYLKAVLGLERAHLNTKEKFGLIPKQNLKVLKVGAKNFYDYDATTYDHSRHPWINGYPGKVEADAILASMPRAKVILTSGAGTGRTVMNLVKRRKSEIIGLDISKNMIKKFKQKLLTSKLNSINLIVADAENLPFRNKIFDVVICSRAIKFFPHPVESLKESYRTLRNGGRIFVISETSDSLLYRMIHKISPRAVDPFDIRFSKSMLVSFFKEARIKIISIRPLISFPPLLYDAPKLILGILKKIDAKAGRYSHVWIIVGEKTC